MESLAKGKGKGNKGLTPNNLNATAFLKYMRLWRRRTNKVCELWKPKPKFCKWIPQCDPYESFCPASAAEAAQDSKHLVRFALPCALKRNATFRGRGLPIYDPKHEPSARWFVLLPRRRSSQVDRPPPLAVQRWTAFAPRLHPAASTPSDINIPRAGKSYYDEVSVAMSGVHDERTSGAGGMLCADGKTAVVSEPEKWAPCHFN
jgi:hypothetical protein